MTSVILPSAFDPEREARYESALREIVLETLSGISREAFLFGSRARGAGKRSSDFDIGIRGLAPSVFARAKRIIEERVEEGPIPHSVDIVDFDRADEPFKGAALAGRIVWKNA